MAAVTFDIGFTSDRDKKSNALRVFYALPHVILTSVLNSFAEVLAVFQWLLVLFTGKRNAALWQLGRGVLDWQARSNAYLGLMYDSYPNFGFERGTEPVEFDVEFQEQANRLTCALRLLWAIPAIVMMVFIGIGAAVVTIISWFAIVFTGRQSQGRFMFLQKAHRFSVRTSAYLALLTDTYPKFE